MRGSSMTRQIKRAYMMYLCSCMFGGLVACKTPQAPEDKPLDEVSTETSKAPSAEDLGAQDEPQEDAKETAEVAAEETAPEEKEAPKDRSHFIS